MFIDIDDVYILDETGEQVDKVTGLFTKNENATAPEKAQARANIAAGGSNDNLLDNAYFVGGGSQLGGNKFPINQLKATSYTSPGGTIDRWDLYGGSVSVEADGVVVTSSPDWGQSIPIERIPAGTYTASVLTASGDIGSITFTTNETQKFVNGQLVTGVNLNFIDRWTTTKTLFSLQAQGVKLVAAKLEKGTVSTLLNDPVPNYLKTLADCQLFYERINATANHTIAIGIGSAGKIYAPIKIAPKIATPIVAATAILYGQSAAGSYATDISVFDADNETGQYSLAVSGTFTANEPYRIIIPAGGYIQFAAQF